MLGPGNSGSFARQRDRADHMAKGICLREESTSGGNITIILQHKGYHLLSQTYYYVLAEIRPHAMKARRFWGYLSSLLRQVLYYVVLSHPEALRAWLDRQVS